jgi:hypothetical protein
MPGTLPEDLSAFNIFDLYNAFSLVFSTLFNKNCNEYTLLRFHGDTFSVNGYVICTRHVLLLLLLFVCLFPLMNTNNQE